MLHNLHALRKMLHCQVLLRLLLFRLEWCDKGDIAD